MYSNHTVNELKAHILELLRFHEALKRPLSLVEVRRLSGGPKASLLKISRALDDLVSEEAVYERWGFYGVASTNEVIRADVVTMRLRQDTVSDTKWREFLKLRKLFSVIPFVEFAVAAGSMALGNTKPLSDFDVIVGARSGRIFSVRLFCIFLFGILRKRRRKFTHHDEANNKICLNHFITESAYCLRPPYNVYWKQLYKNLVPLYGSRKKIEEFLAANAWTNLAWHSDRRFKYGDAIIKRILEFSLEGKIGDGLERAVRAYQLKRIKKGLKVKEGAGYEPRVVYDDSELEFHPDTARIEVMVKNA